LANSARHVTQYLFHYLLSSTEQTDVHHSLQIWAAIVVAARLQVLSAVIVKLLTFWCSGVWCSAVGCCSGCFEKFKASIFMGQAVQKERVVHIGNPIENDAVSHPYSLESSGFCWPWRNLVPRICVPRCLDIRYVTSTAADILCELTRH